jgi:phosphosulfolactate synthase
MEKPRYAGITHVIDRGIGLRQARDLLETCGEFIDILKLGWGTGYMTANLSDKLKLYREFGIPVCFGGTLFEIALMQDKFDAFKCMLKDFSMTHVEVSTGIIDLSLEAKTRYIENLAQDFVVLSEIGSKDPEKVLPSGQWVRMIQSELNAGAWKVVAEARESGTTGIYEPRGDVRVGLIDEIIKQIDANDIIFDAPQKSQQTCFINWLGSQANLGNIVVDDVIALETLRTGLRADTAALFHRNWSIERHFETPASF